jgi:MYXO-CTERM domain-containing protein
VESAAKSTNVRDTEQCGNKPCVIPRSAPEAPESAPAGAGGLGLIAVAALLRVGRRRDDEEGEVR